MQLIGTDLGWIYDLDSNPAELFMSLLVKATGGKRVDFTKGRGYQTRCYNAVLAYNQGGVRQHSFVMREIYAQDPTTPMRTLSEKRERIQDAKRRSFEKNVCLLQPSFQALHQDPVIILPISITVNLHNRKMCLR